MVEPSIQGAKRKGAAGQYMPAAPALDRTLPFVKLAWLTQADLVDRVYPSVS
jgi:hypothetical protein